MAKLTRRLHLRLVTDNPIFDVPAGDRTRQAETWLRLGAEIERLQQLVDRLEKIVGEKQVIPAKEKPTTIDAKKTVLEAFENW